MENPQLLPMNSMMESSKCESEIHSVRDGSNGSAVLSDKKACLAAVNNYSNCPAVSGGEPSKAAECETVGKCGGTSAPKKNPIAFPYTGYCGGMWIPFDNRYTFANPSSYFSFYPGYYGGQHGKAGFSSTEVEERPAAEPSPPPFEPPTTVAEIRKAIRKKMHRCKVCKNRFIEKDIYERHLRDRHPVVYIKYAEEQAKIMEDQRLAELEQIRREEIQTGGFILPAKDVEEAEARTDPAEIKLPPEEDVGGYYTAYDEDGLATKKRRAYVKKISPQCPFCDKRFRNDNSLKKHVAKKHPEAINFIQCNKCFKVLKSMDEMRSHDCELAWICWSCVPIRNMITQERLDVHRKKFHRGSQSGFRCNECSRKFLTPRKLRKHKKMAHIIQKPYKCHFCEEYFPTDTQTALHERIHTGKVNFECTVCDFKTNRFMRLCDHKRREHGYVCIICKEKMVEWSELKYHTLTVHGGYLSEESHTESSCLDFVQRQRSRGQHWQQSSPLCILELSLCELGEYGEKSAIMTIHAKRSLSDDALFLIRKNNAITNFEMDLTKCKDCRNTDHSYQPTYVLIALNVENASSSSSSSYFNVNGTTLLKAERLELNNSLYFAKAINISHRIIVQSWICRHTMSSIFLKKFTCRNAVRSSMFTILQCHKSGKGYSGFSHGRAKTTIAFAVSWTEKISNSAKYILGRKDAATFDDNAQLTFREKRIVEYENRIRTFSSTWKIFRYFATIKLCSPVEEGGDEKCKIYMTFKDFLRSITPGMLQPNGLRLDQFHRVRRQTESVETVDFSSISEESLMSYADFIFAFNVLLTASAEKIAIAFKMFDYNNDGLLHYEEFNQMQLLVQNANMSKRGSDSSLNAAYSALEPESIFAKIFFGPTLQRTVSFSDFLEFRQHFQEFILQLQFNEHVHANETTTTTTVDAFGFAKLVLLHSRVEREKLNQMMRRVQKHANNCRRNCRFSLQDYFHYFKLLNRLDELETALKICHLNGLTVDVEQFKRIVGLFANSRQQHLDHIAEILFAIFDENGDGVLNSDEFCRHMRSRFTFGFSEQNYPHFSAKMLIGKGGYGRVHVADDLRTGKSAAVKSEHRKVKEKEDSIDQELKVFFAYHKSVHCPRLFGYGKWRDISYIVMEILGPTLHERRLKMPSLAFSPNTALRCCADILTCIQDLHDVGYVHRDIKLANLATGTSEYNKRRLYLFDFGLSRKYIDENKQLIKKRKITCFKGTRKYASIKAHLNQDIGRVDDLWSLFYSIIEMFTGSLPWQGIHDNDKILQMKSSITLGTLCEELLPEFNLFALHLSTLKFEDRPCYEFLNILIEKSAYEFSISEDEPFDWEF
ncbi:putative serine/threonine-protein kinase, partial [Trichinella nelsoni]